MLTRIRYKLKKTRIKFFLLIKNEFENDDAKELSSNRRLENVKKIICNPKKTLLYLTGREFSVKYTEIVLTTVCTLNCNGCSALMGLYKKPYHTDVKQNIKSLEKMLNSIDSLRHLRLLGGEPLCYPNLNEILLYVSKQDKIKKATIVTNGTLLINDKKVIELLKNKKFDVFISNYGKVSSKKDELIKQLESNNIKYILQDEDFSWRDYGNLECRNRREKDLKKQYLNCKNPCYSILEGKLHRCPRSSHGTNLNKILLRKQDYVDLLNENLTQKELRKELYKFFYKYVPYVEACNYCNNGTKDLKNILAGVQDNRRNNG